MSGDRPGNPEAVAAIDVVPGRKMAYLYFSDNFLERDDCTDQRHTVVHELVHCHTGPYSRCVEAKLRNLEGGEARDPVLTIQMEYCVDGLADAIAPLMPLPKVKAR